jgi:DNA-directed RNA polymerase specialized sigma24 family protein
MNNFNSNTDWVHNKDSEAIVYRHANGAEVVTLERFLADSPGNTPEMFARLKAESDKLYKAEDDAEREAGENELPIYDWSEKCAAPSLEDELFGDGCDGERQAYLTRREHLLSLLPKVMDKLTPTQLRRLLLYRRDGLTMQKIAVIEGCSQQSVDECLKAAEKKIKKILAES